VLTTSGSARTGGQEFIEASRLFLREDFLPKLLYCLERMSDEDIWWRPNEQSNSVGNLVMISPLSSFSRLLMAQRPVRIRGNLTKD
jgi:hypothetical protein